MGLMSPFLMAWQVEQVTGIITNIARCGTQNQNLTASMMAKILMDERNKLECFSVLYAKSSQWVPS
jgi:hypothetical protein